jgi:hypothetical protein
MRGLDPRIHPASEESCEEMDCRVKPGNDGFVFVTIPVLRSITPRRSGVLHRARDTDFAHPS